MTTLTSPSSHRSSGRTAALLAGLALAAGLTACGSEGDDTATDPAGLSSSPTPSETATETPAQTESPTDEPTESTPTDAGGGAAATIPATGSAGVTEASLVSATEGGGATSTMAFALDGDQAVADFVTGLGAGLPDTVAATVRDLAQQTPDATPYGAVVAVGCEAPTGVTIEAGEAGFEVVPQLPKATVQCLAPVTYVVVFAAPDA
ncbi:hypothetical protein HN031_03450 [Nocardioides sp. zg-1308]|uniref:hypothetical protein n=1 Tax=Nocardioides sp. zg-1308 TaxID=2736253 RepID=UPI0015534F40|nr:hypothetical protein [Nocardioides sp. zg-1308]NPD03738.1 hypothetical protein [Nocardioides sp. zg-1308]